MKQPAEKKAPGTRWRFESKHESAKHLNGRACTISHEDSYPWHYTVFDASGPWVAMDCELLPIEGAA